MRSSETGWLTPMGPLSGAVNQEHAQGAESGQQARRWRQTSLHDTPRARATEQGKAAREGRPRHTRRRWPCAAPASCPRFVHVKKRRRRRPPCSHRLLCRRVPEAELIRHAALRADSTCHRGCVRRFHTVLCTHRPCLRKIKAQYRCSDSITRRTQSTYHFESLQNGPEVPGAAHGRLSDNPPAEGVDEWTEIVHTVISLVLGWWIGSNHLVQDKTKQFKFAERPFHITHHASFICEKY